MADALSLSHRYDLVIQATRERVFDALLDPDVVRRYYFGFALVVDDGAGVVGPGAAYELRNTAGAAQIAGTINALVRPERLEQTFRFVNGSDPSSRVTWTLREWGAAGTWLTLVHDGFESETDTYKGVPGGWPPILSGLKTFLETGRELEYAEPAEE